MKVSLALLLAPLALVAAGAAGPGIAGAWDCVATHANGGETQWSLTIKEDAGKLSATLLLVNVAEMKVVLCHAIKCQRWPFYRHNSHALLFCEA